MRVLAAACFKLIAHWMTVCLTEHTHCQRAVCPYSWTEDADEWARSPSYKSPSSDSEHSDGLPVVETPQKSCLDAAEPVMSLNCEDDECELHAASPKRDRLMSPGPLNGLENEDDGSEIYEVSETQISSGRPPKSARLSSPGPATSSDSSEVSASRFGPDPAVEALNLKQLQEYATGLWEERVLTVIDPDTERAVKKVYNLVGIRIVTSLSCRTKIVRIGGAIHNNFSRANTQPTAFSITLGPRSKQNSHTAELVAIAKVLRLIPPSLSRQQIVVFTSN